MHVRRSRRPWTVTLVLALLAWSLTPTIAGAHARLLRSEPADGATVATPPATIRLTFTEPLEVRFSTFWVYRLEPQDDSLAVEAAASELVERVLNERDVAQERVDSGTVQPGTGTSETIEVRIKEGIEPGPYVVLWRALSVDTHVVEGHFVFTYEPPEP